MAFFSSIVGVTVYLGTWQTHRYFWKVDKIEERERSLSLEPVTIPPGQLSQADLASAQHRRVKVTGQFELDHECYVGPRSAPKSAGAAPQGMATSGVTGHFAIAPLRRADGSRILVNRGWLPREEVQRRIAARSASSETELGPPVFLTGVLEDGDKVGVVRSFDWISPADVRAFVGWDVFAGE